MHRRIVATVACLVTIGSLLTIQTASAGVCGAGGVFCAGAATADITPPVTSPQWGYTFRHCAVAEAADTAAHTVGEDGSMPIVDHVEEGASWILQGGPQCTSNKVAPDTDLYTKTYPPSEGTYGRLLANAYVLADAAGAKLAIVNVDLGGLPGEVHEAVAKRIAPFTGIGREQLLISATHTHGAGGGLWQYQGYALLAGDEFEPRIFEAVVAGITRSILEAYSRLRPARLAVGQGTITNANHNRRKSAWDLNPEASSESPNAYRLFVIRVDTTDGIPLGVITNFANHGVIHGTFNFYLSGDNQGQAVRQVSRAIRAAAEADDVVFPPGWEVVDSLVNGAQGDITPECDTAGEGAPGWNYDLYGRFEGSPFGEFACMENGGARQVDEALRVWRSLEPSLTADITLDSRFDWICFCAQAVPDDPYDAYDRGSTVPANDDPNYFGTSVEGILGFDDGTKYPRTVFPAHHKEGVRLIGGGVTDPNIVRIGLYRIGDLALAAVPGEPTIQMGRRIERSVKAALGGLASNVAAVGLANDYSSYFATIQEYEAYLYEGGFSLFGQQTGNLIKWRLVQLAERMRYGEPVPPCTLDRGCLAHPDTTFAAAEPMPLTPDLGAGTVSSQPPAVLGRLTGTSFAWVGGGPSAEWSPDDPVVELQKAVGPAWVTVTSDLDQEIPLHYDKHGGMHHWRAYFEPNKSWPLGTYRFFVTGHAGAAGLVRSAYSVASSPFDVVAASTLGAEKRGDGTFAATYPAPDPAAEYRYRERYPAATITGVSSVRGLVTESAPFTLAAGETLTIDPGGITDAYENTNGAPVVLTG
jgi:neutral ceramidase